ncbi:MAG: hypothetical protein ABSD71_02935 [Bacteroidales bacterium]
MKTLPGFAEFCRDLPLFRNRNGEMVKWQNGEKKCSRVYTERTQGEGRANHWYTFAILWIYNRYTNGGKKVS